MAIKGLESQARQLGEIRIGDYDGEKPVKLDTFRFTSKDRSLLEDAAKIWGGEVQPWQKGNQTLGYELISEASEIDVIIPPQDVRSTQFFEQWVKGGCKVRCDGEHDELNDKPCHCDPKDRDCAAMTRVLFMLPDVRDLGVWKLATTGIHAAKELPPMIEMLLDRGVYDAVLAMDHREKKTPGKPTFKFAVPIIKSKQSLRQLEGQAIDRAVGAAINGGIAEAAIEGSVENESTRPAVEIPSEAEVQAATTNGNGGETVTPGMIQYKLAEAGIDESKVVDWADFKYQETEVRSISDIPIDGLIRLNEILEENPEYLKAEIKKVVS